MAELHGVFTLTLGGGTQMGTEAEHAVQTAVGIHRELIDTDFTVVDGGVTLVQERDNITLELRRRRNDRLHQGLQDRRATLRERLTEGLLRGVLERHFR